MKNILRRPILLLWICIALGLSSIVGGIFLISHGVLGELPSPETLDNPVFSEASIVYTADSLNIGTYYKENRSNIKYDELPIHLVDALIATEDVRFNEHSGIDARGLARAIAYMGTKGGASTITQQLAKMLFHDKPRGKAGRILQKVKEWIIAVQLEKRYTKQEIVALYFNQLDFVNQAVGIQSAALVYFNRSPKMLSTTESAMLVGMAKNPSLFNPIRRPDTTRHRRNVVMHQMWRYGFLSRSEYDSLKVLPLGLHYQKVDHKIGVAPYFRQVLRKELKRILNKRKDDGDYLIHKEDGIPYNLYSDGLRIYTSIDSRLQRYAENAMAEHIKGLQKEFTKDIGRNPNSPFNHEMTKPQVRSAMKRVMKGTSRYRILAGKECGGCGRGALSMERVEGAKYDFFQCEVCLHEQVEISMDSIERIFSTKVDMEIFSWEGSIKKHITPMDSLRYYKGLLHAGLLSVDPRNGFVKAWVGGIDKKYFSYDHVSQGKRQVGSTFKPILYAFALQHIDMNPCEENPNIPYTIERGQWGQLVDWTPKYGPKFEGMVSYKFALANSMNNITAHLMSKTSPVGLTDFARDMGITSPLAAVASLCLGVADISLEEMVGAYATFANEGVWEKPQIIVRIDDKFGNTIYQPATESREVLSSEHAYIMLDMMKGMADGVKNDDYGRANGTGRRRLRNVYKLTAPIAGKTGTTQNSADGWFMGITPDLVTGVWVGAEDRRVSFRSGALGQGAHMALPIWAKYMQKAYADNSLSISQEDFAPPNSDIQASIDCDGYSNSQGTGGFDNQ